MNSKNFPQEGDIWIVKFEKLKEFSKPYRPCVVVSNKGGFSKTLQGYLLKYPLFKMS